ncbi:HAMP domain-containing sensor histidine kinase [Bacillus spongiae]|uniref:histidine kinase n=1 Tax=Bacillus spongiae TaxID=2683610 RepID=A0ABU8HE39_9BACI
MIRNREIQLLLMVMCSVSIIAIIIAAILSPIFAWLMFIVSIILIGCCFVFTWWRYRELATLSGYLRQISSGDYTLDVRDNREGELSILKDNIYKMTRKLSEQSAVLQQEKLQLTNAISDISHQLKTPLTSMTVMTDLISDVNLPEERRIEFTRNIEVQLERIEWLVSSLLKLSKIDAGTVIFKKNEVIVDELIRHALQPVLITMEIKEQTVSIEGNERVSFYGDFNWTAEALINILKNCVEHTMEGGKIEISFSENVLFTEITISDNGKGISKEDLPYIFKRFYRGKNANDDSVGIGLAMAQSIVTSQNGTIEVESGEEQGTQFRLKFYKSIHG